jgi:hypothetical protein
MVSTTPFLWRSSTRATRSQNNRALGRSENPGVGGGGQLVVFVLPQIKIGLTYLPKDGSGAITSPKGQ